MSDKNRVLAGDYEKKLIGCAGGKVFIVLSMMKRIHLDNSTIEHYEIVDEEKHKSVISAVGRGLVGSLIIGLPGLLAGLSAKSKGQTIIAIQFKDGKKSLINLDLNYLKVFMKKVF